MGEHTLAAPADRVHLGDDLGPAAIEPVRWDQAADPDERRASLEAVTFLNERGVLCKFSGRFALGERLYRRAPALSERAFGADRPAQATLYHNLGGLEHACGRYDRAEPLARRSVALRRRARPPGHPEVLADEVAPAAILDGTRHREEASGSTAAPCAAAAACMAGCCDAATPRARA